jgi:acyl carrier protein
MPVTQELIQEIRGLLAETMDIEPERITDDAHFMEDLHIDSLMALEVMVALEKRFNVTIKETELQSISCLRNVMTLLEAKGIA